MGLVGCNLQPHHSMLLNPTHQTLIYIKKDFCVDEPDFFKDCCFSEIVISLALIGNLILIIHNENVGVWPAMSS